MKWALLFVLLSGTAQAATAFMRPNSVVVANGISTDSRTVYVCFIPDAQNQTSMDDEAGPPTGCTATTQCVGAYCTQSPYCSVSWQNTGRILTRNLAYDLTGQWSKIDWSAIRGPDNINAHPSGPGNHPRCDIIVGLGDMTDVADPVVSPDPALSSLTAAEQLQWDIATEFWQIIRASGIPYIPARGNHEVANIYASLMATTLAFQSNPFFYAVEPTRQYSYAIKVPTATGKSFCIIAQNSGTVSGPTSANNTERTWMSNNIGCGSSSPTIIVEHGAVDVNGTGALLNLGSPSLVSIAANAAKSSVFLFAGGHWTPACHIDVLCPGQYTYYVTPGAGGYDYLKLFSNYQEMNRHGNASVQTPYGLTPSDGAGDYYTVMAVNPIRKSITFTAWSPYWQGLANDPEQIYAGYRNSTDSYSFDFDARFP